MSRTVQSGVGPAGRRSHRTFTPKEAASAKRLGLMTGTEKHDRLGGPIFWGTGDFWPSRLAELQAKAQQAVEDCELVIAALEREWHKEGAATEGQP